jgi:hypothetical protein
MEIKMYKICSKCKEEKLFSEFSKDKSRKDGFDSRCKSCVKEYQKDSKDDLRDYHKEYREINRSKRAAWDAKRRATKLQATPVWLTSCHLKEIENFYKQAQYLQQQTGQKYHVDHIIPLQGREVCGLHVPWNLQVVLAKENLSKSNKLLE